MTDYHEALVNLIVDDEDGYTIERHADGTATVTFRNWDTMADLHRRFVEQEERNDVA